MATDPGSELLSTAFQQFKDWLGLKHKVSLVDIHTSCGVENTNKLIIGHLKTLTNDARLKDSWSDDCFVALVQYHLNSEHSTEAGCVPFHASFGSEDETYYKIPRNMPTREATVEYIRLLDANLELIRSSSKSHQRDLVKKRDDHEIRNQHQVGDFVLKIVKTATVRWKPEKIGPDFLGPFEVMHVNGNSYEVKHVTQGIVERFDVTQLKPYFGTREMAKKVALLDYDQYYVVKIHHYTGDVYNRTRMEFFIEFADGDQRWQYWSTDLFECEAYTYFCQSRPELWSLVNTVTVSNQERALMNKSPIYNVFEGMTFYVDLRMFGSLWYNGEGPDSMRPTLPEEDYTIYVVPFYMHQWCNVQHTAMMVRCDILNYEVKWNHDLYMCWGQYQLHMPGHILIDQEFLNTYPQLLKTLPPKIGRIPMRKAPNKPVKKKKVEKNSGK